MYKRRVGTHTHALRRKHTHTGTYALKTNEKVENETKNKQKRTDKRHTRDLKRLLSGC